MEFEEIHKNLQIIREKLERASVKSGRSSKAVEIIAATKKQPLSKLQALLAEGVQQFGENYLQEALEKKESFKDFSIDWHYFGKIQSKKWKKILENFSVIHSFDRLDLLDTLENARLQKCNEVFIEINLSGEISKGGLVPENLIDQIPRLMRVSTVHWKGLMVMPPLDSDGGEGARPYFAQARSLRDLIWSTYFKNTQREAEFRSLSMGTSHDYEVAIEEGSTHVRLGTCLLGQRK